MFKEWRLKPESPNSKREIFGDENYQLTAEEISCENDYKAFCHTRTLEMLDNMRIEAR